jgi:large subunit ribosomal protein L49
MPANHKSPATTDSTQSTSAASIAADSPPPPATTTPQLTYHVSRTHTNNLPVYTDYKSGGSQKITMITKIAGDAQSLRADLEQLLKLDKKTCWVKPPAGHIILKGHHTTAVTKFLQGKGF